MRVEEKEVHILKEIEKNLLICLAIIAIMFIPAVLFIPLLFIKSYLGTIVGILLLIVLIVVFKKQAIHYHNELQSPIRYRLAMVLASAFYSMILYVCIFGSMLIMEAIPFLRLGAISLSLMLLFGAIYFYIIVCSLSSFIICFAFCFSLQQIKTTIFTNTRKTIITTLIASLIAIITLIIVGFGYILIVPPIVSGVYAIIIALIFTLIALLMISELRKILQLALAQTINSEQAALQIVTAAMKMPLTIIKISFNKLKEYNK